MRDIVVLLIGVASGIVATLGYLKHTTRQVGPVKYRLSLLAKILGAWHRYRDHENNRRKLSEMKLVAVIQATTTYDRRPDEETHFYSLYQNALGERSFSFRGAREHHFEENHPMYNYVIEWEAGLREVVFCKNGIAGISTKVSQ